MFRWAVQGIPVSLRNRGHREVVDSNFISPVVQDRNLWAPSICGLTPHMRLPPTHISVTYSLPSVQAWLKASMPLSRVLPLVLVFPLYTGPHLAAKRIFPRHRFVNIFHLRKIPPWIFISCRQSPWSWERIQVPGILVPSSLSCVLPAPGEHAMLFPPSCLFTDCFFLSEHFSHHNMYITTHSSRPNLIIPSMTPSPPSQPELFTFSHLPVALQVCLCCHIYNTLK